MKTTTNNKPIYHNAHASAFVLSSNALVYRPTGETAHQASGTLEAEKNKPTGDLNKKAHQASCLAITKT